MGKPPTGIGFWNRLSALLRGRLLLASALAVFGTIVLVAVLAPWIAPHDPLELNAEATFQGPSTTHLLGTDRYGRDLLSRLMFGARVSLGVAGSAVIVAMAVGGLIGLLAGYYGRWVESISMRLADVFLAFPALLLAITLAAGLGPSARNATLAIAVLYTPIFARIVRASALVEMRKDYVDALRVAGASSARLMFRHLLPNISTPIVVQISLATAAGIELEAGLSFLGLGTQPPAASWGSILGEGRVLLSRAPWLTVGAGLVISVTVLALFLIGDGLRDALDPTSR